MIVNEISSAAERPQNSRILIAVSGDTFTILIPPPNLPLVMKLVVLLGAIGVVAFFTIGLQFLVFHHSIVLDHSITESEFRTMPPISLGFYTFGWLMMTTLSAYLVAVAARPMTKQERIVLAPEGVTLQSKLFGKSSQITLQYAQIRDFHDRPDRTGMLESKLLARLKPSRDKGSDEEIEFAQSTTEAEKQWLASVLNVLLKRHHPYE